MYISHIEMMKAFMRALRRANLDVAHTKGFNPNMRMVFALPLPLGVTSDSEYVDIWFNKPYEPYEVLEALADKLPEGIQLLMSFEVEKAALMEDVGSAIYHFKIEENKEIKRALDQLIQMDEINVFKSNKKGNIDLLPLIYKIDYHDNQAFSVLCKAGAKGNLNPHLLINALEMYTDIKINVVSINRNKLFLKIP